MRSADGGISRAYARARARERNGSADFASARIPLVYAGRHAGSNGVSWWWCESDLVRERRSVCARGRSNAGDAVADAELYRIQMLTCCHGTTGLHCCQNAMLCRHFVTSLPSPLPPRARARACFDPCVKLCAGRTPASDFSSRSRGEAIDPRDFRSCVCAEFFSRGSDSEINVQRAFIIPTRNETYSLRAEYGRRVPFDAWLLLLSLSLS